MKIIKILFLYFLTYSTVIADDTAEAVAAILNVTTQKYIDSVQVQFGTGAAVMKQDFSPEINAGMKYHFLKDYHLGVSLYIPVHENNNDLNIYGGVNMGLKNFSPRLGQHYLNLLIGAGNLYDDDGLVIEPSITFAIKESSPLKFFWILQSFGINTSLSYRHFVVNKKPFEFHNANAIKFNINLFMRNRKRSHY